MLPDKSKLEEWIRTLEICRAHLPPDLDPGHHERLTEMINYFYIKFRHGEDKF